MLEFKIYDHRVGRWCAEHQAGTHLFSTFVLSEDGNVLELVGNYENYLYSIHNRQFYVDELPVKIKQRYTVCPWIGVKDNFDNKIYAGDIVLVKMVEKEHRLTVKYDYNTLSWLFCDENRRFGWQFINNTVIKVIGNILTDD